MAANKELVLQKYDNASKEEGRATRSRSASFEFYYTKKHLDSYITSDTRILEVGCGTGHYGMYYADKCKEYVGIDLSPSHIELFLQKIEREKLSNVTCSVGDATRLDGVENDSFDVWFCALVLFIICRLLRRSRSCVSAAEFVRMAGS